MREVRIDVKEITFRYKGAKIKAKANKILFKNIMQ